MRACSIEARGQHGAERGRPRPSPRGRRRAALRHRGPGPQHRRHLAGAPLRGLPEAAGRLRGDRVGGPHPQGGAARRRLTAQRRCTASCCASSRSRPSRGCASRCRGWRGTSSASWPSTGIRGARSAQADLDAAEPLAAVLGLRLHAEQLWRAVNRHRTERDRLIKQAISAQEAERRRIAFDLHDGVTTALASMSFHLSAADLTVSEVAARRELSGLPAPQGTGAGPRRAGERARAGRPGLQPDRAAISGLHSLVLDDLGLVAAIESLVQIARS